MGLRTYLDNTRGQILAYVTASLLLIIFAGAVFLFLLYRQGMFRFEFGPKKEVNQDLVFDRNKVLELFKREQVVKEQMKDVAVKKEQVENLRKQIDIEKSEFAKDKQKLDAVMQEISVKFKELTKEEETNLLRLSKLYSKMKAQRVAKIFDALDEETVAQLLVRMQDKDAAKILGEIGNADADKAARISNIIEGKIKKDLFAKVA